MHRLVPLLTLALLLAACGSSGKNFDETRVGNIKNGHTSRVEIEQWFGMPGASQGLTGTTNGAVKRYTWSYGRSTHGGASTKAKALVVDFNDKDVVVDHAYSEQ
ncbi:MAG: hypothetical protein HYY18_19855 [Planctomycetes bacterium]|nr:hypothetical protein [Planctomycetota bacterium]